MKQSTSKLSRMSMPSKKPALDDVAVMELEMEPADESDDSAEMDAEMAAESDEPADAEGPLAEASDEELLAELRKRGLSGAAEKASSDEPSSDDEY